MHIDQLILEVDGKTVVEAFKNIDGLSLEDRKRLRDEYKNRPDIRFSDNLLIACSLYFDRPDVKLEDLIEEEMDAFDVYKTGVFRTR